MVEELYENLKEMYESFFDESQKIKKKLEKNLNRISEIDRYLEKLYQREENDFSVFSPRSAREIYKEDIDGKEAEKKKNENDNQYYYRQINQLEKRIRTISSVLNAIEKNSLSEKVVHQKNMDSEEDGMEKKLYILDIQEKERQRIARDLHDGSLQNLAHLTHKIELAGMYIDEDTIKAKLELASINNDLKQVIQEIRNTIFDLRPMSFDDLGLKESLERLTDKWKEASGFDIHTDIETIRCDNSLVLMTIFRIAEECINNAVKHSCGNSIMLSVKRIEGDFCSITAVDNGKGFNSEEILSNEDRHFGLCILKERVSLLSGTIKISSDLGSGTEINILIPLTS